MMIRKTLLAAALAAASLAVLAAGSASAQARCVAEASEPGKPPVPHTRSAADHPNPQEACARAMRVCEDALRRAGPHHGARCRVIQQPQTPQHKGPGNPPKGPQQGGPGQPGPTHAGPGGPQCDIRACESAYRSFRASDCTFQPYHGPRKRCDL